MAAGDGHTLVMRPVYTSRLYTSLINTNNDARYRPYIVDVGARATTVTVDSDWWGALLADVREAVRSRLAAWPGAGDVTICEATVDVPHGCDMDDKDGSDSNSPHAETARGMENALYAAFVHMYDQHVWLRGLPGTVEISGTAAAQAAEDVDAAASPHVQQQEVGGSKEGAVCDDADDWMQWLDDEPMGDAVGAEDETSESCSTVAAGVGALHGDGDVGGAVEDVKFITDGAQAVVMLSPDDVVAMLHRARAAQGSDPAGCTTSATDERALLHIEHRVAACAAHIARVCGSDALFAKLTMTSGKRAPGYEHESVHASRPRQIMVHFWHNAEFLSAYEKCVRYGGLYDVGIVLQPWIADLDIGCEFRVFVHRHRVTGISQQAWYQKFAFTSLDLRKAAAAILALYDEHLRDALPYRDVVLDVWVDPATHTARLIECNCFGAGFASGSALFNWAEDYDKLYNTGGEVHVKYATCCRVE